jgi:uncharacterized protein YlzI (FlbEa/FlbD family)
MSKLARLTEAQRGIEVFVNPDHVRLIHEIPGGSQITFSDGGTLIVKEAARVAVAALQMEVGKS